MNVLSLFDGMSCGRLALERIGIKVDNYFASEIDKYAIQIAKKNYPDIVHVGDVKDLGYYDLPKIDLLIGGSPCQGFSFAGKQLNFEDPRSRLFFEYVRLLKNLKPKYFMLENVSMKQEYQDIISEHLGVSPVKINSDLVSAQNRKRLYWTNIPGICQPEDKGIMLKDIVHEKEFEAVLKNHGNYRIKNNKSNCIDANYWKGADNHAQRTQIIEWLNEYKVPFDKTLQILDKEVQRGKVGYFRKDSQANRVYYIHGKSVTLCGDSGGGGC